MSQAVIKENRMGTEPLNSLLLKTGIPLVLSMLVQALYNVVDSLFVSRLSQEAFNAVSLAFPIQNIMIAIAAGTGTGLVALISRALGKKKPDEATSFTMHGILLMAASYALVCILGSALAEPFFRSQTDIEAIVVSGVAYTRICCIFSFGLFGQVLIERLMQSVGKSILSMWTQLAGAITNIILDPIFIFGAFGIEPMGVAGAAVATVVGQIVSFVVGIILFQKYNNDIKLSFKGFRPSGRVVAEIYKIGFPSTLTLGIGSVMTYMMNRLLISLEPTATAAAVFGAYFKLQSFLVMPTVGLSHAMTPIVGFNLGAKNKARMLGVYKLSIIYATVYMILGTIVTFSLPGVLLSLFNATDNMLEIGIPAFRIICFSFLFIAFNIMSSSFFMACGKSLIALVMSSIRQLIVLIPVAYLLGYTIGYSAVWFAVPAAEFTALVVACVGMLRINKTMLSALPDIKPESAVTETV